MLQDAAEDPNVTSAERSLTIYRRKSLAMFRYFGGAAISTVVLHLAMRACTHGHPFIFHMSKRAASIAA
jgi:hypothetical protein